MTKLAFVFPGQGSQDIGMAQSICAFSREAKNTFQVVAEACDFDLAQAAWVGPAEALKRTRYAQPALLATSAACLQAAREIAPDFVPAFVAGHSLGELSALWSAGVINLPDVASLTVLRGQLMDEAEPGAMAAVLGVDLDLVESVCAQCNVAVANYNTPQQLVISGSTECLNEASNLLKKSGAKVIALSVSGAFHSPAMNLPNAQFVERLQTVEFSEASCPVVQNLTATATTDPASLKDNLLKQMVSPVRWTESVMFMIEQGVDIFVEIGSGRILSGLIKKIRRDARVLNIEDAKTLQATIEEIRTQAPV